MYRWGHVLLLFFHKWCLRGWLDVILLFLCNDICDLLFCWNLCWNMYFLLVCCRCVLVASDCEVKREASSVMSHIWSFYGGRVSSVAPLKDICNSLEDAFPKTHPHLLMHKEACCLLKIYFLSYAVCIMYDSLHVGRVSSLRTI